MGHIIRMVQQEKAFDDIRSKTSTTDALIIRDHAMKCENPTLCIKILKQTHDFCSGWGEGMMK